MSLDLDAMEKAARDRAEDCTDDRWEAFLNAFDPPIVLRLIGEHRALLDAARAGLAFAEHELDLRRPSGDPEYIAYAERAVEAQRAAIAKTEAP